jgi:copper chaperone CopZ
MTTVTNTLKEIDGVLNVHMNADYSEVMIVSASVPDLQKLQDAIAYDGNYHIEKMM